MGLPRGNKKGSTKAKKDEIFAYMDKGLTAKEAYQLVKPENTPTKRLLQIYNKEHKELTLANPILVKKAHEVIAETLDGEVLIRGDQVIAPTYTNRLTAAQMVLDRAEPIIKINQNLNVNAELKLVDLSKYARQGFQETLEVSEG